MWTWSEPSFVARLASNNTGSVMFKSFLQPWVLIFRKDRKSSSLWIRWSGKRCCQIVPLIFRSRNTPLFNAPTTCSMVTCRPESFEGTSSRVFHSPKPRTDTCMPMVRQNNQSGHSETIMAVCFVKRTLKDLAGRFMSKHRLAPLSHHGHEIPLTEAVPSLRNVRHEPPF